mmetsp:Transcript_28168/g.63982  ORF Transcript_28168/g.63982 Transcript_28168/m.63982 type:complete len:153 (+) Transcript_28168:105-563(+)
MKGTVSLCIGWIGVLGLAASGMERFDLPHTSCQVGWAGAGLVSNVLFNWSLNWATLILTPLSARLSLLLGIPVTFVLTLVTGGKFRFLDLIGIGLVLGGVVGFEIWGGVPVLEGSDVRDLSLLPTPTSSGSQNMGDRCSGRSSLTQSQPSDS